MYVAAVCSSNDRTSFNTRLCFYTLKVHTSLDFFIDDIDAYVYLPTLCVQHKLACTPPCIQRYIAVLHVSMYIINRLVLCIRKSVYRSYRQQIANVSGKHVCKLNSVVNLPGRLSSSVCYIYPTSTTVCTCICDCSRLVCDESG